MESTGAMVRSWLTASGLTAATVARRAGVSASTVHRVTNDQVDPSVGVLREIAYACGVAMVLSTEVASDPDAAAAARTILEDGYPAHSDASMWVERLHRLAGSDDPVELVRVAAFASSPLHRPGAVLLAGDATLARLASVGDATKAQWALSGAAGLYLADAQKSAPPVTILWVEDLRRALHLLAETDLRETERPDRASVAVISADPPLFFGAFTQGIVRYVAPIQIIIDCLAQGAQVAWDAEKEALSW